MTSTGSTQALALSGLSGCGMAMAPKPELSTSPAVTGANASQPSRVLINSKRKSFVQLIIGN
jgi:hypothetical protein